MIIFTLLIAATLATSGTPIIVNPDKLQGRRSDHIYHRLEPQASKTRDVEIEINDAARSFLNEDVQPIYSATNDNEFWNHIHKNEQQKFATHIHNNPGYPIQHRNYREKEVNNNDNDGRAADNINADLEYEEPKNGKHTGQQLNEKLVSNKDDDDDDNRVSKDSSLDHFHEDKEKEKIEENNEEQEESSNLNTNEKDNEQVNVDVDSDEESEEKGDVNFEGYEELDEFKLPDEEGWYGQYGKYKGYDNFDGGRLFGGHGKFGKYGKYGDFGDYRTHSRFGCLELGHGEYC